MSAKTSRADRPSSVCPPASGQPPWSQLKPEDLAASAEELLSFHDVFHDCFSRREQRRWSLFYLCGQLSNTERKTIEPMVLTLQGADPNAGRAAHQLLEAINTLLAYDAQLRIAVEPKPNEPMDLAYIPTMGHALALGFQSSDPKRVGVLMETAHSLLAGLDPADEIGFAMAFGKLWSVHLNDQNGLKFDQDRSFGAVNLRGAFNQVRVLDENRFWEAGVVGLDVKALRTQPAELATKHLRNSLHMFLRLVELSRSLDRRAVEQLIANRDYEELDWLILDHLMGK